MDYAQAGTYDDFCEQLANSTQTATIVNSKAKVINNSINRANKQIKNAK